MFLKLMVGPLLLTFEDDELIWTDEMGADIGLQVIEDVNSAYVSG